MGLSRLQKRINKHMWRSLLVIVAVLCVTCFAEPGPEAAIVPEEALLEQLDTSSTAELWEQPSSWNLHHAYNLKNAGKRCKIYGRKWSKEGCTHSESNKGQCKFCGWGGWCTTRDIFPSHHPGSKEFVCVSRNRPTPTSAFKKVARLLARCQTEKTKDAAKLKY